MNNKNWFYAVILYSLFFLSTGTVFSQNSEINNQGNENKLLKTDVSKHFRDYGSDSKEHRDEFASDELDKSSYNYFRIDKTGHSLWNGKHWKPDDFPLSIYVKTTKSKLFKSLYKSYVDYALSVWEDADERIKFKYVSNTRDADIVIMFEESLVEKYDDNYLGITDYRLRYDKKIQKSYIELSLLKFNNEPVSEGEIKSTIIHELGHALGLGHSDNETDIMFPFINPFSSRDMHYNELSGGDIEAVRSVVNLGYGFILN
jgi:predicted Zn-dependent protease